MCTLTGECTASCSLPSSGCGVSQTVFCSTGPDWEAGVVCTLAGEYTASCSLPSGGCGLATESVCFSQQHGVPELGSGDGAHTQRGVPVIPADHGVCVSWRVVNLQCQHDAARPLLTRRGRWHNTVIDPVISGDTIPQVVHCVHGSGGTVCDAAASGDL